MKLNKRRFLQITSAGLIAVLTGGTALASHVDDQEFSDVALLVGPDSARPAPDSNFFDNKRSYHYHYIATDTGARLSIETDDTQWSQLPIQLKSYAVDELPAAGTPGRLFFDTNRQLPVWDDDGGYEYPNFVDDVLLSQQTVANTTTRTSVFNPDIDANSLVKGRIYQLDLQGTFETANTSDQFTVDVGLAGTDVAGLQNAPANASAGTPWTLELTFSVREHGTSGVLKPNTRAVFDEQPRTANASTVTVDTTTANQLEVFITWSAADPSNVVNVEQAHLKQMA